MGEKERPALDPIGPPPLTILGKSPDALDAAWVKRGLTGATQLAVAQGANVLLGTISVALIARYLGTAGFGEYAIILALIVVAGTMADFGMNNILVRDGSRARGDLKRMVERSFRVRLALITAAIIGGYILSLMLDTSSTVRTFYGLGAISVISGSLASYLATILQIHLDFGRLSLFRVLEKGLFALGIAVAIWLDLGYPGIIGAHIVGSTAMFLAVLIRARRIVPFELAARAPGDWSILRSASWFGLTALWILVAGRLSIILAAPLVSETELSNYAAAFTAADQLNIVVASVASAFFPILGPMFHAKQLSIQTIIRYSWLLAAIALPICLAITLLARPIMHLLFGAEFVAGAPSLAILSWSFFIFLTSLPSAMAADATGFQWTHAFNAAYMGLASVILILILAPRLGDEGISLAVLISRSLGLIVGVPLVLLLLKRYGHLKLRHEPRALEETV